MHKPGNSQKPEDHPDPRNFPAWPPGRSARRPPGRVSPEAAGQPGGRQAGLSEAARPGQPRGAASGAVALQPLACGACDLPFRVATLLTGLLECLGFAGVLLAGRLWCMSSKSSITSRSFANRMPGHWAMPPGWMVKGAGPSLESGSQVVGRRARQDSGPPTPTQARLSMVRKRGCQPPPSSTWT